ncbi:MAG: chromosome segregation protein SMC [Deltaproteobacteria bacterium]|nr:chromosome segregation protein SMC [Deltaproteobacteria bacterium]MBI3294740.1 chromosome segregation protein SMC [Deltaproteobacteria bacterium]
MRLKRLELQGFKSFVDRTIVHFENKITGVVGPNGCGKSNIVDAILWVMGEQSPSHLRGKSMTDVIFNGSENRAATSMAEVSLILDKQGVMLAPEYAAFEKSEEISITRRIYRDGQGEYLINKQMCRLKDIHELFMDTGVGRRAYSIIEQGQIDRMINVKPEERRGLFEEVAGITKYKAKKKEAVKKLEATTQNLLRLQDITGELEKQMRSLKIQATRARKYREIKSELETVDLHLLGRKVYEVEKTLKGMGHEKERLLERRSELEAQAGIIDAEVTEAEVKRLELERAFQTATEMERGLAIALEKLESTLAICGERRNFIQQNSLGLSQELADIATQLTSLQSELERVTAECHTLANELSEKKAEVGNLEHEKQAVSRLYTESLERKTGIDAQLREIAQSDQRLQAQIYHGTEKETEYRTAQTFLAEKVAGITGQLEALQTALIESDGRIESVSNRYVAAESEASQVATHCQETSSEISRLEDDLFAQREHYHRRSSRLQSLEELSKNLEGYLPTAREVRNKIENATALPLAEIVQPESDREEHLEHILGGDMNTLLTQTAAEAKQLAAVIQDSGLDRVGILSMEGLPPSEPAWPVDGVEPILNRIRVTPGYEAVAGRYLGHVYVCADRDALFDLRSRYPHFTFVSRDGKVVGRRDGSLTCGQVSQTSGIFTRRREMEALRTECEELNIRLIALTTHREHLLQQLESQEQAHEDVKSRLSSIHVERVELRKEKEKIQIEFARSERDLKDAHRDSEANMRCLETVQQQLGEWRSSSERLVANRFELDEAMAETGQTLERCRSEMDGISSALEQKRVEISGLTERVSALEYQRDKGTMEIERLTARDQAIREQVDRDNQELQSIQAQIEITIQDRDDKTFERSRVVESLGELKTNFDTISIEIQELRDRRGSIASDRNSVQEEFQGLELDLQQRESDRAHLQSISQERYHRDATPISEFIIIPLERIPLLGEQLSSDWLSMEGDDRERLLDEHLNNLRQKIERYGEVNLTAIQEFEEIERRFGFLNKQKEDLDHAVAVLQEAIIKIDETTKIRFEETFHVVNAKFKEIFPILFNGGKAELSLTAPMIGADPGIDVMVQPPGKRLQSMSLLSGGEKALTAVSLILSIFARKPSPFCLLDEVDAPLDDANVSRFNTVIRKMSQKTQFIVITHNKKTMEMAEALYGVTMERAGVSKLTSVRLN